MEPIEAVVKSTYLYPHYSAFMSFIQNIDFDKFRQIRINPRLNEKRSIAKYQEWGDSHCKRLVRCHYMN